MIRKEEKGGRVPQNDFDKLGNYFEIIVSQVRVHTWYWMIQQQVIFQLKPSRWRKKGLMAIRASFFLRWKVVLGKRLFNRCFIHRLIRAGSTINFHSFLALVIVTTAKSLIKCSSRLANLMLAVWIFPTGVTQICLPANAFINGLKRVSKCVCVVRFLNVSNGIWRK